MLNLILTIIACLLCGLIGFYFGKKSQTQKAGDNSIQIQIKDYSSAASENSYDD